MKRYKTNNFGESPLTASKARNGTNVLSSSANSIVMPQVNKRSLVERSHSTLEYPTTHADTLT